MRTYRNLLRHLALVCLAAALSLGATEAAAPPPTAPAASDGARLPVIVQLIGEPAAIFQARLSGAQRPTEAIAAQVQAHAARLRADQAQFLQAAQGFNLTVRYQYTYVFNGLATDVRVTDLAALAALPGVRAVHPDTEVRACLPQSVPLIGAPAVWAMTDPGGQPVTGAGIRVAVIDTGVDYTHVDLGGDGSTMLFPTTKVITGYDFINNDPDPFDDNGHGTHCAGIVAASGHITGVAPAAQIMAYKVLSAGGSGSMSAIVAGIERACDPDGNPATDDAAHVISMSLGGPGNPGDAQSQAVDAASALGIPVVVAAGNEGPGYQTLDSPGVAHSAITVGAASKSDVLADFSSRGPVLNSWGLKPDLCAPGVDITSTVPLDGKLGSPTRYLAISGTSMATPHVAGVAALLRQLHPHWSPATIKATLMQTSLDLGLNPYLQGSGRVQAPQAALNRAVILPASLSLGADDLTQPVWSQSAVLALTNLTTHTLTYTLAYTGHLPAGVNILLTPAQLTVGPGQTQSFSFQLTVDNSAVPNVADPPYAYTGQILAQPHAKALTLRVPFAFIKTPILTVNLETASSTTVPMNLLVHNRADWQQKLTFPAATTSFAVTPGEYDVVALFSPPQGQNVWRFVTWEKAQVGTRTEVTLRDTSAIHRVTLATPDEQGQPITPNAIVGRLLYPPLDASLSPFIDMGTAWDFSDVSSDYRFEAAAARKVPEAGDLYVFLGQQDGVADDVTLQPGADAWRRVSHPLRVPTAQGVVRLSELRVPFGGTFDYIFQAAGMTTTLPYARGAHYAAAPSSAFATGYLWRTVTTADGQLLMQCAPLRREADGRLWGYPPLAHPILSLYGYSWRPGPAPLFVTDADVIPLGLNPPHWFARVVSRGADIELRPVMGDMLYLFASQWSDMLPTNDLPYTLQRDGAVVREGRFPADAWSNMGSSLTAFTIPTTATGHYSLTVPFTYTLGVANVVTGQARAVAEFDTAQPVDRDPPAIVNLWLTAGGAPTDEPYGSPEVRVTFTDTVGLAGASVGYNAGAGWNDVPLTLAGDERRGAIPAQTPNTWVALRFRAWDAVGNTLTYELWPAYVQAPYQVWLPLVLKDL